MILRPAHIPSVRLFFFSLSNRASACVLWVCRANSPNHLTTPSPLSAVTLSHRLSSNSTSSHYHSTIAFGSDPLDRVDISHFFHSLFQNCIPPISFFCLFLSIFGSSSCIRFFSYFVLALQARAMLIHCFQIASATYLPLYPDHTSLHVKELFPPPWPSCLQLRARRRCAFA